MKKRTKTGVNPVTIRPGRATHPSTPPRNLTIGRLGINGVALVSVMTWREPPVGADEAGNQAFEPESFAVFTEAQFVEALGHLFPRGELARVHLDDDDDDKTTDADTEETAGGE